MLRSLWRAATIAATTAALALPAVAHADGGQNMLHPESKQAQAIWTLWWVMLGVSAFGFAVIVFLLVLGWVRRDRASLPFGGGERAGTAIVVGAGIFVMIALLSALFVWSDIFVLKTTEAPAASSTRLTVKVIGKQWFWEVRYPGTEAVTANEIHIPVRTRVNLEGTTADVIHSFWVPELNRKTDMIPGQVNRILLDADRAGTYRGQCAEYCGLQHAHMSMLVFADPEPVFRRWLANEERPGRAPATAQERLGRRLFMSMPCSGCHTIRGTPAAGTSGPDLTHLASRTTIGALTLDNTRSNLADWIQNSQRYKPGNKMPGFTLTKTETDAIVAYLERLR